MATSVKKIEPKQSFLDRAIGAIPFLSSSIEAKIKVGINNAYETIRSGGWLGRTFWNGEKNFGEMGPVKNYMLDYGALRARSWELYLTSEVAAIIFNAYQRWMIGQGLKLEAQPDIKLLKEEGIKLDMQDFSNAIEARFRVWAGSRKSDWAEQVNLHKNSSEAFKNKTIGGDVLVVLRFDGESIKIQLIDGGMVSSPYQGTDSYPSDLKPGVRLVEGIEISPEGRHLAYWVQTDIRFLKWERIPARSKSTGMIMAYLVYGSTYRLFNHRGMPLLGVVMEMLKKMDRYKEATVAGAEEQAKIPYYVKHDFMSSGENPMDAISMKAFDPTGNSIPHDDLGQQVADKVYATTNKMTFNLPQGADLKTVDKKGQLYFKDYYTIMVAMACAAGGIPVEVALAKYDSNYSASRGALKDWENSIDIGRSDFGFQFYNPIYALFMDIQIRLGKLRAIGYLIAQRDNDWMVLEAYRMARWVGKNIPHIDPLKEVQAVRMKLGSTGAHIPLTTVEAATEELNGGDSQHNMEQYAEELKRAEELDIKPLPDVVETPDADKP